MIIKNNERKPNIVGVASIIWGLISVSCTSTLAFAHSSELRNLTVEYNKAPIDVDTQHPRFSWQMNSDDFGVMQQAYRIVVKGNDGRLVWDSGKVSSDESLGIPFQANTLTPEKGYKWELTVWDNKGNEISADSQFETAWFNHDKKVWQGAEWIGSNQLPVQANYLPLFRIKTRIALDEATHSNRIGVLFGANDPRLMDKNRNLNGMENALNHSYVSVVIDTSGLDKGELARLNVYRVGYTAADKEDTPLFSFEIPDDVINKANRYQGHDLEIISVFGSLDVKIDDGRYTIPKPKKQKTFGIPSVNINPMGYGSDYIAYPMLSNVGFQLGPHQKASVDSFTISNFRGPSNALWDEHYQSNKNYKGLFADGLAKNVSLNQHGLMLEGKQQGLFLVSDPSKGSMPMLRRSFDVTKKVKKARLYATARGVYEAWTNGNKLDNGYLNPGLTQYDKTQRYQVTDVTQFVHPGENVLAFQLAEGWWSGNQTFVGKAWNYFGDRSSLLVKLVLEYEDGTTEKILSEPNSWKVFNQGPLRYGSLFQGQIYDATREKLVAGWTAPGFDDSQWLPAQQIKTEGTTYTGSETFKFRDVELMKWSKFQPFEQAEFYSQGGGDVRVSQKIQAKSVTEVRPGVFVYDMGQNMAGVPEIVIPEGKNGQKVRMRYAEMTYPDLPEYKGHVGMVMMENIRGAMAQDIYVLKGGRETIAPRYTIHGYRYIEISGLDKALPLSNISSLALSSVKQLASSFQTSNKDLNQLWKNITWSMRSNFVSIPTDTPARNERMGWGGDISVFAPTANYIANMPIFLRHHMKAIRDVQSPNGRFDDVAPIGGGFGGLVWGSAGITVAWESWRQFNDLSMLKEHYAAMQQYMVYLDKTGTQKAGFLGDWLSPEGSVMGPSPANYLLWDAYYAYDLRLMSKMAEAVGDQDSAKIYLQKFDALKRKINHDYLDATQQKTRDPQTNKPIDTMSSYAVLLGMELVNEDNKNWMSDRLVEKVKNPISDEKAWPHYSLMTGFIGTAWISKALSLTGHSDIAYKLLVNEQYPSWLYPVTQGATTIWERLNSYTKDKGFSGNNSMNSFNHYSFGSVGAWMYQRMLGLQRKPQENAFKQFVLAPEPDWSGNITFANGHYDSLYGRIESGWKVDNDLLIYKAKIPANTQADLILPCDDSTEVLKNGEAIKITELERIGDHIHITLGSGTYQIQTTIRHFLTQYGRGE